MLPVLGPATRGRLILIRASLGAALRAWLAFAGLLALAALLACLLAAAYGVRVR
jgi:hypothetical protein